MSHKLEIVIFLYSVEDWSYVKKKRTWRYLHNTLLNAFASIYFHNYIRFVNSKRWAGILKNIPIKDAQMDGGLGGGGGGVWGRKSEIMEGD
jgi:hypothetical protein